MDIGGQTCGHLKLQTQVLRNKTNQYGGEFSGHLIKKLAVKLKSPLPRPLCASGTASDLETKRMSLLAQMKTPTNEDWSSPKGNISLQNMVVLSHLCQISTSLLQGQDFRPRSDPTQGLDTDRFHKSFQFRFTSS